MSDRQDLIIHLVGENRLRMIGVIQIDSFVELPSAVRSLLQVVRTEKSDVASRCFKASSVEEGSQLDTTPLGNAAPSFDAIMPRNLGPRRELAQICKGKLKRIFH